MAAKQRRSASHSSAKSDGTLAFIESVNSEPGNLGIHRDLTPDVTLPSQFFGSVGARTFSSEQRLLLAVLVDAINLVLRENRDGSISFKEASSWIFASGIVSPLSFDLACEALELNAQCLRRRLSELVSQRANLRRLRFREQGQRPAVTVNTPRGRK
jgi:hypothetical protein